MLVIIGNTSVKMLGCGKMLAVVVSLHFTELHKYTTPEIFVKLRKGHESHADVNTMNQLASLCNS